MSDFTLRFYSAFWLSLSLSKPLKILYKALILNNVGVSEDKTT
jgi:hypothetical protein